MRFYGKGVNIMLRRTTNESLRRRSNSVEERGRAPRTGVPPYLSARLDGVAVLVTLWVQMTGFPWINCRPGPRDRRNPRRF
jgi:hypothetical protein